MQNFAKNFYALKKLSIRGLLYHNSAVKYCISKDNTIKPKNSRL